MKNKKALSFPLLICAIVISMALYKQFHFETLTFEKPALALVYGITLAAILYFWMRSNRNKVQK